MNEKIIKSLENLLKLEDILACLVAGKGIGTITPRKGVKLKDVGFWKLISDTIDKFFDVAEVFYKYGLSRIDFELGDYNIILKLINPGAYLVAVIPSLANKGLLEVEIENTRREIEELIET